MIIITDTAPTIHENQLITVLIMLVTFESLEFVQLAPVSPIPSHAAFAVALFVVDDWLAPGSVESPGLGSAITDDDNVINNRTVANAEIIIFFNNEELT
jgi:hypothetical protein